MPSSARVAAGEQLLDQVTPEAHLDVGDAPHVRQLESQHRRTVLQRPPVLLGPGLAGVDDRDDTQHVVSELGDRNDSIAALQRPAVVTQDRLDELLALVRRGLWIWVRPVRAGPGHEGAEGVLDGHGEPGELVDGLGDPVEAFTGHRYPCEAVMDVQLALERLAGGLGGVYRPLQRQVGRALVLRDRSLPCGRGLFLPVQTSVGQGARGLLGEQAQQELLRLLRLCIGRDHQETHGADEAGQGVRPGPGHARQHDRPPGEAGRGELRLQPHEVGHLRRLGSPGLVEKD